MVPDGWSEEAIAKILRRISRPVKVQPGEHYREIGIRSHGKGVFDKPPVLGRDLGNKRVFWVEPNCFVVNIVFAWEQAVGRTYESDAGKIASHRFPMYAPRDNKVDIDYITYFFKTPRGKHLLSSASPGGAGRNKTLGQKEFDRLLLCLPPIEEQKRIAELLLTWDRAIATVQALVENSLQQNRAVMRRLLAPDANEGHAHRTVRLSEIAEIIVSNVDKKIRPGEQAVKLCNYTDVYYNDYISADLDFMRATATAAQVQKFSLRKGDIVITKDSETPDDIAVPALVTEDLNGVLCGYHLAIVRPHDDVDGAYLRALFSLKSTQHYFFTRANGATRFGLSVSAIEDAVFTLPPLIQQRAVAQTLRGTERSIRVYQGQLAKLNLERKALSQQLLTGKCRVRVDEASEEVACA